jgi:hypothetical protein
MNRTITFTPRELEMIMTALDTHTHSLMSGCLPTAEQADTINEFNELRDDLLAESSGHHDDWPAHIHVNDADDLAEQQWQQSAEAQMIQAGIDARELMKKRNRERARAAEAFGEFEIRTGSLAQVRRIKMLKGE